MRRIFKTGILALALSLPAGMAHAQNLAGQGYLRDEPNNSIEFKVEDLKDAKGQPDKSRTVFVLEVGAGITRWKSLDLFSVGQNGDLARVFRIETADGKKRAEVSVLAAQIQGMKHLETWKSGFLNIGHMTTQTRFNGTSLVGKRITIIYHRD